MMARSTSADAEHAAALGGDPVALARALISIPSVNPDLEEGGAGEGPVAAFCANVLEAWGLSTSLEDSAPGRPNVTARLPGTGPTLLLNGHLDTVGVRGMTIDPFAAEVREGRLWGRGSCDMKGGVAALMSAAHVLAKLGQEERPNLIVCLTADEENASVGMAHAVDTDLAADCAVVCEPTGLTVMPAHKGFVWMQATFQGRAAHGSRPELGVDAIRHAALYLSSLDAHAEELRARPPHPFLGHGSFHAGTVRGGSGASVYPESCELVLERRTLPGERTPDVVAPFEGALAELGRRLPDLRARLDVSLERPGTEVPESHALVRGLLEALRNEGCTAAVEGMSAWVDAAYLNEAGIPTVCFGPGSIEQAHTVDEWIEISQLQTCADVLIRFACTLVTRPAAG